MPNDPHALIPVVWSGIASTFALTLRQEEQVYASARVAAGILPSPLHLHWLFYLTALKYALPGEFLKLCRGRVSAEKFQGLWEKPPNNHINVQLRVSGGNAQSQSLFDIIREYYVLSSQPQKMAADTYNKAEDDRRLNIKIISSVFEGNPRRANNKGFLTSREYIDCAATVGVLG